MNDRNRIVDDIINEIKNLTKDNNDMGRRLDSLLRRVMRLKQPGRVKAGHHRQRPKEYPTALGRNIDALRLEMGWSYDDLASVSGISKKRILDHVNRGTRPRPHVLKEYSETFSNAFKRPISVADLLTEMRII